MPTSTGKISFRCGAVTGSCTVRQVSKVVDVALHCKHAILDRRTLQNRSYIIDSLLWRRYF